MLLNELKTSFKFFHGEDETIRMEVYRMVKSMTAMIASHGNIPEVIKE